MEQNEQLEKVLTESGLQLNDAELIKQSYLPYFQKIAEVKEEAKKINFENPTDLDEKIARELRLRTVKIRTGSKDVKDERKRIHMLKANIEQDAWNLIKSTCELDEETFYQVEKKRELAEISRKQLLSAERNTQLQPYSEFVDTKYMNLGEMDEEKFQNLLKGAELQLKQKQEEAHRIAEEEAERKRLEAERIEAQRIENERLKAEAEAKAKELEAEKAKAESEKLKQQAILEAERKKADELLEAQRKQAEAEKAKQQAILDAERKKAEEEAKKQSELLAKQEAENKRLKEEADAKVKAELEAKKVAEEKAIAQQKAQEEAKKKAAKAPDKVKLKEWVDSFVFPHCLQLESQEANEIGKLIIEKRNAFINWADKQIESL